MINWFESSSPKNKSRGDTCKKWVFYLAFFLISLFLLLSLNKGRWMEYKIFRYYWKKCQKHTYSPPQKKFNWLIGRRLKTISSKNVYIFVRVSGLLTRQKKYIFSLKKYKETPKQFINYWWCCCWHFCWFIHSFFFRIMCTCQTVDWKKPYFYSELTFILLSQEQ